MSGREALRPGSKWKYKGWLEAGGLARGLRFRRRGFAAGEEHLEGGAFLNVVRAVDDARLHRRCWRRQRFLDVGFRGRFVCHMYLDAAALRYVAAMAFSWEQNIRRANHQL